MTYSVNSTTQNLAAYPMEELHRIKLSLKKENKTTYDFGVGDPKLPLWKPAVDALKKAAENSLGYPSVRGSQETQEAHEFYLKQRFAINPSEKRAIFPTRGSKEAIFHIAFSLIGRKGKHTLAYPKPGYPVYKSSALFAHGKGFEVELTEENQFLMEPWTFPKEVIKDLTAIWVNYPHNPTGKSVDRTYWEKIISWCHENDVILLSDESYVDMHHVDFNNHPSRPATPLSFSDEGVIAFFSLSKRSGFTGLRAGFMAGDKNILEPHMTARANFGLAAPHCIQEAANLAWKDSTHVESRKKILSKRLDFAFDQAKNFGLIKEKPINPFYLWLKIPDRVKKNDIGFCLDLAKDGFIATPGAWLGAETGKHFRLSLTLENDQMSEAFKILKHSLT